MAIGVPMTQPAEKISGMPAIEPVQLTAGPLLLRPWRPDDVDAVWAALQDPETRLWNGGGVLTRDDAAALVARRADWSSGDHASWAVADRDGVLASVSLHSIDPVQTDAEIGYWTAAGARGRGIAAMAVEITLTAPPGSAALR